MAVLTRMTSVADGVRSLCQEVQEVVVPHGGRVLSSQERQGEREALLDLLDERAPLALPTVQKPVHVLSKQIRLALPHALVCARCLDAIQDQAAPALGAGAVALMAWAWLRRAVRGPTSNALLHALDPAWRALASFPDGSS
jgi:hypothetical protein